MIRLPPGCTINYEVTISINSMPTAFLAWWEEIGGKVVYSEYITPKGKSITTPHISYGRGRMSHKMAGLDEYLVRFRAEDAGVALMLLMKWDNLVITHNMREVEKMKEAYDG